MLILKGPPPVVVTLLLKVKADPVKLIPLRALVFNVLKEVRPVPASWVIVLAKIVAEAVTFRALVICKLVRGVARVPTAAPKVTSCPPAAMVKFWAP